MSEITASAKAEESEKPKNKRSAKKDMNDPSFNMDELRELADLVDEYGFTDFEFENENIRVRLSRMTAAPVMQQVSPMAAAPASSQAGQRPVSDAAPAAPAAEAEEDLFKI